MFWMSVALLVCIWAESSLSLSIAVKSSAIFLRTRRSHAWRQLSNTVNIQSLKSELLLSMIVYCWNLSNLVSASLLCKFSQRFTLKFVVALCAFCKLGENFGFFCSVNHLSGPLRKHMLTWRNSKGHGLELVIGGFRSVWLVSVLQGSLLVIVLFRVIID